MAREAIKLDNKNPKNHLRLATIYKKQWRFKEASSELDTAIKLDPDIAVYYRNRAGVKLAQGDLNSAIARIGDNDTVGTIRGYAHRMHKLADFGPSTSELE